MALTDNIVGCWSPSVRGSGLLLPDLSGRGNHGTLTNMAGDDWVGASVRGVSGRVLDYDGSNDYVSIPSSPYLDSASQFTLSAWMRRNVAGASAVVQKAVGNGNRITMSLFSDGNLYFVVDNGGTPYGTIANTSTAMQHVVGVFDGGGATNAARAKVYIDGREVTLSYVGTIPSTTGNLSSVKLEFAAERWAGLYSNCKIGEVATYSRPLAASEIAELYRRGNGAIGRELTGQTRRRVYGFVPAGFKAYWVRQKSQIIGGGV